MKFPTDARKNKVIKTFQALGFQLLREGNHIIMERKNSDVPPHLWLCQITKQSTAAL